MRGRCPGASRRGIPLLLLCGLLWTGCARKPPPPLEPPGEHAVTPSYEARFVVHIQHEGSAKRSAQGRWVSGPGGSLLIAARYGPLVPLLTLAANPDSLQLLLPRQNAYGAAGREDPVGEGDSDVTMDDAVHWLRGVLEPHGLPSRLHRPKTVSRDDVEVRRGLADGPSGKIVSEVWRDLETGRIQKWSLDEIEGRRLLLVEYPDKAWSGDALLPGEIRLFWPVERLAALIVLQRSRLLSPPPPPARFVLDPPPDARRGRIDVSWKEVLE
jgi:hypothetical protein